MKHTYVGPGHELQALPEGRSVWSTKVKSHVCLTASKGRMGLYLPVDMWVSVTKKESSPKHRQEPQ